MAFKRLEKKGIPRFLVDERLSEGRLSIHRSTLPPGASSHDPHTIHNRSGDEIEYIVIQSSEGTP